MRDRRAGGAAGRLGVGHEEMRERVLGVVCSREATSCPGPVKHS